MKSVIVFYMPTILGSTEYVQEQREKLNNHLHLLKDTDLGQNFHIIIVQDPDRKKIEVEVFFKPK